MNKNPILKFQLNLDLDIDIAYQFMELSGGGVDFGSRIVDLYPELSKARDVSGDERKAIITDFTKKYYEENKSHLEKVLNKIESEWESVAEYYFSAVDKVFHNQSWPDGQYICYLSIFDCNPRFLETKSFQVFMGLLDRTNYIIAHEMLHFMFFDYLDKHESDFKNKQDENLIWLLSEWFNDLMLNMTIFKKFGQNVQSFYPDVVEFSKKFKDGGANISDIKSFFKAIKTGL